MAIIYPATGLTDSFEALDGWTASEYGDDNSDHVSELSNEQINRSNYSLKSYIPASHAALQGTRQYVALSDVGTNDAYDVGFFLYIDPSTAPSADNFIGICRIITNPYGVLDLGLQKNSSGQYYFKFNLTGGSTEHVPHAPLVTGCWHQIRWRMSGFSTGAIVSEVWLDGQKLWWDNDTQVSAAEGTVSAGSYPLQLWMGIIRYDPVSTGEKILIYQDDVRVSNSGDMADILGINTHLPTITGNSTATIVVTLPVPVTAVTPYINLGTTTGYGTNIAGTNIANTNGQALSFSLTGLLPNTTYHYRFSLSNDNEVGDIFVSKDYTFKINSYTAKVTIIGDIQNLANRGAAMSQVANSTTSDLVLMVGDLSDIQDYLTDSGYKTPDGNNFANWADMTEANRLIAFDKSAIGLKPLVKNCLVANVAGNHDFVGTGGGASADYFKALTGIPSTQSATKTWYSFDYGHAHFLMLVDMGVWHTSTISSANLAEIEADLKASNKKWKIVVGHYPLYYVPSDTWAPHASNQSLHSIFKRQGVNMYINGHRHKFNFITYEGIRYLINSAAGTSSATDAFTNPTTWGYPFSQGSITEYGYTQIEINEFECIVRAYKAADNSEVMGLTYSRYIQGHANKKRR
jgi:hypothetical protein